MFQSLNILQPRAFKSVYSFIFCECSLKFHNFNTKSLTLVTFIKLDQCTAPCHILLLPHITTFLVQALVTNGGFTI